MRESLPDSVAVELGIIEPEPLTRAIVELDEKGKVVESRQDPETPPFPFKEERTWFCGRLISVRRYWSHYCHRSTSEGFDIGDPVAAEQVAAFLTNLARLTLLTATEMEEYVLAMGDAAASMVL